MKRTLAVPVLPSIVYAQLDGKTDIGHAFCCGYDHRNKDRLKKQATRPSGNGTDWCCPPVTHSEYDPRSDRPVGRGVRVEHETTA